MNDLYEISRPRFGGVTRVTFLFCVIYSTKCPRFYFHLTKECLLVDKRHDCSLSLERVHGGILLHGYFTFHWSWHRDFVYLESTHPIEGKHSESLRGVIRETNSFLF